MRPEKLIRHPSFRRWISIGSLIFTDVSCTEAGSHDLLPHPATSPEKSSPHFLPPSSADHGFGHQVRFASDLIGLGIMAVELRCCCTDLAAGLRSCENEVLVSSAVAQRSWYH
jgi:hypothetical protein